MILTIRIKPIVLSLAYTLFLGLQTIDANAQSEDRQYPSLDELFKTDLSSKNSVPNDTSKSTDVSNTKNYPAIEAHIENQQFEQAYQKVIDLRDFNEGNPRFDYLYGISALQTGHISEAIFTLERVTANYPNVIRPHLELARAYLKDNNDKAAIREFNTVLALNPPLAVRKKVNAYLTAIKEGGKAARKGVVSGLVSFSLGYDDNINLGFAEDGLILPVFGNVTLNPSSVQQESAFAETELQLKYYKSHSNRVNYLASFGVTDRQNFENSDFNTTSLDIRGGSIIKGAKNKYQFMLRDRPVALGGKSYSNTIGVDAMFHRNVGVGANLTTGLSVEDYDYKPDDSHDRKRAILSANLNKIQANNLHQFSAYGGKEIPDDEAGKEFSRDMLGIGYRLLRPWNKKQKSFLKFDYQRNKHQAPHAIYQQARKDDQVSIQLGHHTKISDNWGLNASIQHNDKNSNLELFDASRNEIKVGVQYDWN